MRPSLSFDYLTVICLDVEIYAFHQIWGFAGHFSLKYFLSLSSLSPMCVLVCLSKDTVSDQASGFCDQMFPMVSTDPRLNLG